MRYAAAFVLLTLAGLNGLLAWTVETCTGNAPDSLFGGLITLLLNCIGVALLAWRPRPLPLLATFVLPALLASIYTVNTAKLTWGYFAHGMGACDFITDYGPWGPSGDEPFLIGLWIATAAIFWLGLLFAGLRSAAVRRHQQV